MNKKKIVIRSILVLLLIFIIYLFVKSPEDKKLSMSSVMKDRDIANVEFPVRVTKIEYGTLVKNIKSNGTVRAFNDAEIVPQLSGRVVKSNIHEGKFVRSGELLLELDDREYTLQLSRANNDVMKAQLDYLTLRISDDMNRKLAITDEQKNKINALSDAYNQAKLLYEKGEISQDDYLKTRNDYELAVISTGEKKDEGFQSRSGLINAFNELKRAELNLSYTKIQAPFSGVIANYDLSVGSYISTGKAICNIVDISKLKLTVYILESDVPMLNIGRSADVVIPALGNKVHKGTIITISPIVDPDKKTCKIEIILSNPDMKIKPGMFANCIIEGDIFRDRIIIPKDALLIRQDRKLVFIRREDKAEWRYVTTGTENDDSIEILEGLNVGDELIIEGHYTLSHNATIKVLGDR